MGLTFIDKNKPPSPRYVRVPPPEHFKSAYEEDKYWDIQFDRWENGYSGLTGIHYFHLQEIQMYSLKQGKLIRPGWRDVDDLIFPSYNKATTSKKDLAVFKKRGIGLSSIFGGSVPLYHGLTTEGATILLTSADKGRVEDMFKQKLKPALNNLHPAIAEETSSNTKDTIMLGRKLTEIVNGKKINRMSGMKSTILCKPSQLKPDVFEGARSIYGFLDELFLHPKANEVFASMAGCFSEGLVKYGTMVLGGTSGDQNIEGTKIAQQLFMDADILGIIPVFIPGWMGDDDFSVNGHSDEKAATEFIMRKREELSKLTDLSRYRKFVKDYPLTIEEIFSFEENKYFPEETVAKIANQRTAILREKRPIHIGNISEETNGDLHFKPDLMTGKIKILEHPSKEHKGYKRLFIGGIDPIPFNNADDKGSQMAIVILRRDTETPVAIYAERSTDEEAITQNCILLQRYYHDTEAMIETNHGGVAMKVYRDQGYYHKLLADQPTTSEVKFKKKKGTKGVSKTGALAIRITKYYIKWLEKNTENIWFIELIDDLLKFGTENTDYADAFAMALVAHEDWTKKDIKEAEEPKTIRFQTVKRQSDGTVRMEWVERKFKTARIQ